MKRTICTAHMSRLVLVLLFFGAMVAVSFAARPAPPRYEINFPDVPGGKTLVCDFHMHTVFSDGTVWPTVRVNEAWRTGLDVISITDHIENQRYKKDVPPNRNRSTDMVVDSAATHDLIFIKGGEITRKTPPGHYNAIFLKDVDLLNVPGFLDAIEAANQQDAFVFWNHHDWQGKKKGTWSEVQDTMFEKKWLHGMEVANGGRYYPRAHKWCLEKGLTMIGNSDIHPPDLRRKSTTNDHRTLTLVFAKERTLDAVKAALKEGRTAVWHKDMLIGREAELAPLFAKSVEFEPIHRRTKGTAWLKVRNVSPMDLRLTRTGLVGPYVLTLPAESVTLLSLYVPKSKKKIQIDYTVENLLVAPKKGLSVSVEMVDGTSGLIDAK